MPKIIDYPRATLQRAFALAEVVDKLGGESTEESAADHMGNKIGGAFRALVSAAVKFGLVTVTKGRIKTEPLFSDFKLAYNDADRQAAMRKAFLSPALFAVITKRLEGKEIPTHFEKLLIREHGVPEDFAPRLATYFIEGARDSGILNANGTISMGSAKIITGTGDLRAEGAPPTVAMGTETGADDDEGVPPDGNAAFIRGYTVRITGPGIDSRIGIKDEEDVDIVEAMLKKVRRLIKAQTEEGNKGGG